MNNSSQIVPVSRGFRYSHKLPADRADIPQHQKNRSHARSFGRQYYQHTDACKKCGSLVRNTKTNKCKECAK